MSKIIILNGYFPPDEKVYLNSSCIIKITFYNNITSIHINDGVSSSTIFVKETVDEIIKMVNE